MNAAGGTWEAVVLGGGVLGAAAAEILGRRGHRTLLVERFSPGHEHGSSHGDGRIIRYSYPEEVYVEMAGQAYAAWRRLENDADTVLLERTGSLECGPLGCAELADLETSFRRSSIAYQHLDSAAVNRRFAGLRLSDQLEALYQEDGGIVRAGRAVETLWSLLRRQGVATLDGLRVVAIEAVGDLLLLVAEDGRRISTERLLLAAGGWSGQLLAGLGLELPLTVTQEQVAYFPAKGMDHGIGALPTLIDYSDPQPFYALPQIDIAGVKVGWHRSGWPVDPDQRQPTRGRRLRRLASYVEERLPHLEPRPLAVVDCLYTNTPDFHFIIDRHPDLPQVSFACGLSGHGFKFAPVIAEALVAVALDQPPPMSLEMFAADRFGAPQAPARRTGA